MQGAFGGPQAAQQQQVPYGANMGYGHQPNYYTNYGVSNAYGAGFQQPAAGYSGYGVGYLCSPPHLHGMNEAGQCSI